MGGTTLTPLCVLRTVRAVGTVYVFTASVWIVHLGMLQQMTFARTLHEGDSALLDVAGRVQLTLRRVSGMDGMSSCSAQVFVVLQVSFNASVRPTPAEWQREGYRGKVPCM
jgi:hypothetical protein